MSSISKFDIGRILKELQESTEFRRSFFPSISSSTMKLKPPTSAGKLKSPAILPETQHFTNHRGRNANQHTTSEQTKPTLLAKLSLREP